MTKAPKDQDKLSDFEAAKRQAVCLQALSPGLRLVPGVRLQAESPFV